MAPLNQEYSKMLRTPVLLRGARKIAVNTLQRQIRRHSKEIIKLRSIHNTHAPISGLPAELLSEVFLYVVESGLQGDNTRFATGTFGFRQVCRNWDRVAVGFPRLWVWLVPGTIRAWPVFNARSKDAPLLLTWQPRPHGSPTLMDPTIPGRIRVLNFSGTNYDLEYLLGTLNSSTPSNTSSVRLHVTRYDEHGARKHPTGFLSLSFPKLSRLDVKNFLPDFSSPIFTTSDLVSLKLNIPHGDKNCYTRSQFSKILQHHPNLQELHLWYGGMPQIEPLEPLIPVALPRLADLQLYGSGVIISGFVSLIGTSSPLRNVIIDFDSTHATRASTLADAVKIILMSYYESRELDHHKADHLTISSDPGGNALVFHTRSRSASYQTSNLELRFDRMDDGLVEKICLLFRLDNIGEFTAIGLSLPIDGYYRMFQKMEGLFHLWLENLDIESALEALIHNPPLEDGFFGPPTPNLQSLTLTNIDMRFGLDQKLLDTLDELHQHEICLENLVVRSCHVYDDGTEEQLAELVTEVTWEDVTVVLSDNSDDGSAENKERPDGCGPHCDGCDECEWQFHYPYTRPRVGYYLFD